MESIIVKLVLHNSGRYDQFVITVKPALRRNKYHPSSKKFIRYNLKPQIITLQKYSSGKLELKITAFKYVVDGLATKLTITAQSRTNSKVNNFIEIDVMATTRPRPKSKLIDNVSQ